MTETEVERLVVRLTGDGSIFQKMLATAQTTSQQAATVIEAASKRIEGFGESLKGFASTALTALGSFGAAKFLKSAFDMFVETERVTVQLSNAIELNGRSAAEVLPIYQDFTKELKKVTGASTDDSLALLKQAELYGMVGGNAEKAVRDSIGLSKALGGEASHYLMTAKAIQEGNAHMIHRIPALRGIKDGQEKLNKAQEFATRGFQMAGALMNTTEGIMKRYHGSLKALTKQFGAIVAEGVRPVVKWMTELIQNFTKLDAFAKKIIVVAAFIVAGILMIGPAIKTILIIAGPIFGTLFSMFTLFGTVAAIALLVWINSVGGIGEAWNRVKGVLLNFVKVGYDAIASFIQNNRALILGLAVVTAVVLASILAWKTFIMVLTATNAVLTFLKVQQILGIALWALWKVAVIAATAVLFTYNTIFALLSLVMGAGTIATLAMKAATWLLNAALTVMNALLVGTLIVALTAIILTIAVVAIAIVQLAAIVYGAWEAISSLFKVLVDLPGAAGPLGAITDIFGEWGRILKAVWQAVGKDSKLAWELLSLGFQLAVSQVKDLWPPLWTYLREGFKAAWVYVTEAFDVSWERSLHVAQVKFNEFLQDTTGAKLTTAIETLNQGIRNLDDTSRELKRGLIIRMREVTSNFRDQWREATSEATEKLRGQVIEKMKQIEGLTSPERNRQTQEQNNLNTAIEKTIKLQASLYGSTEALGRIAEYKERLDPTSSTPITNIGYQPQGMPGTGGPTQEGQQKGNDALAGILEQVKVLTGNPLAILGAGL